ncbi:LysR substrate-binding domain-containing protein [Aliamphritea spongicola]|uniref:LysR substrate-binding domain-containing protein n=1 Tax=Aliamphritea spongicola TaxID=707589 RepID=UPI00196B2E8A|nr:LysR substrate-binding domain-containing protein [Aliamphritea spongicola]MBN3564255.1 LysR family transcriptional regulator [Aliamphritea spongicola]
MSANLSSELLNTFVTVVHEQGFIKASERLHKTQSTVSQQIKKLEQEIGVSLFQAEGRKRVLTPEGEVFLGHARRILSSHQDAVAAVTGPRQYQQLKIGISQALSETLLPSLLGQFRQANPQLALEVHCGFSQDLGKEFDAGNYDLVLLLQPRQSALTGLQISEEPLAWVASPQFYPQPGTPLPLAFLSPRCQFRQRGIDALDQANIGWQQVYHTSSFASLMMAVRAGLGITVRPLRGLGQDWQLADLPHLPELPPMYIELRSRPSAPAQQLEKLLARQNLIIS